MSTNKTMPGGVHFKIVSPDSTEGVSHVFWETHAGLSGSASMRPFREALGAGKSHGTAPPSSSGTPWGQRFQSDPLISADPKTPRGFQRLTHFCQPKGRYFTLRPAWLCFCQAFWKRVRASFSPSASHRFSSSASKCTPAQKVSLHSWPTERLSTG